MSTEQTKFCPEDYGYDDVLMELIDRPISYHRSFAQITGSVATGVMLAQLIYWAKRTTDPEKWFYKTQKDWQEETGLTRTEQESSRKKLKTLGLLEEKKAGVPCVLYFRFNFKVFKECLKLLKTTVCSKPADWNEEANKNAEKPQTGKQFSRKQLSRKLADNLYTEMSTEMSTEMNKEADFVFSEIRDLKNQALDEENINQTDKAKDQDPIPPTPLSHAAEPEKAVKRYPDPMGDRMRSGKKSTEWTRLLARKTDTEWLEVLEPWSDIHGLKPNFKTSLIEVTKQHLKGSNKPYDFLDAQTCLINYIEQDKVSTFQKMASRAEGIEEADRRLEAMQITKPECVTTYCYLWQPKGKHTDKATGNTTISWDRISIHEPTTIAERDDRQIAILQEFLDKLQARGLVHLAIANKHSLLKGSKVSPIDFHEEVNQVIGICLQQLAQNYQGVAA